MARPRNGGVGTWRCDAARSLPPRGWNSSHSVWRQAGYGGQRHDAFAKCLYLADGDRDIGVYSTGDQRSSLAPGMTPLVFFWHEGGRNSLGVPRAEPTHQSATEHINVILALNLGTVRTDTARHAVLLLPRCLVSVQLGSRLSPLSHKIPRISGVFL